MRREEDREAILRHKAKNWREGKKKPTTTNNGNWNKGTLTFKRLSYMSHTHTHSKLGMIAHTAHSHNSAQEH